MSVRVLLVTRDYPPPPGGVQTLTQNLKRGLENKGHEVELCYVPVDSFLPDVNDLRPRLEWFNRLSDVASRVWMYNNYLYRKTHQRIREFDPDVIHATNVSGWGAVKAGAEAGVKTVVSTHGLELNHEEQAKAVVREVDSVHSVSNFTASLVTDLVPEAEPYVVPPSIDVGTYEAAGARHETVPKKVVSIARLVDRKNVGTVIEAWRPIEEAHPDAELVIVGDGPNKRELMDRASDLDSIRFTGWVSEEKKLRHLAESELFVLLPRRFGYDVEGFGIVYIEAQAAGTPVIGSRHGGAPEAIGEGGIIVEDEMNAETFSEKIEVILIDEKLRQRYCKQAQIRIEEFDIKNVAGDHVDHYSKIFIGDQG